MASFATFLEGYESGGSGVAAQERRRAEQMGKLQQMGILQGMQEKMRVRQEEDKLRGILSSDLPEAQKMEALKRSPGGIGILQKMAEIQKREAPVFAPAGSVPYVGGVAQTQIPFAPQRPERPEATPPDLKLLQAYEAMPEGHPQKAMLKKIIDAKGFGREEALRLGAELRPAPVPRQEPAPSLVYRRNPDGSTSAVDFRTGKEVKDVMPPGALTADIRGTRNEDQFVNRQYNASSKPSREILGAAETYRAVRATGDSAQSAVLAADVLQRAARGGGKIFKGEADKILGGGYRGGSVDERFANYLSQLGSGSPTDATLRKLDQLMDAVESASIHQIANQARYFAGQVKGGSKQELMRAIGRPFVHGRYVVAPDGTVAVAKDNEAAQAWAKNWMETN